MIRLLAASLALLLLSPAVHATCDDCVDYSMDPAPALLGSLNVTDDPVDVAVRGNIVYVLTNDQYANPQPMVQELITVDATDPSALVQLDAIDTPWGLSSMSLHGDHVYAAGPSLAKFDISDPLDIQAVGFLDATEFPAQDARAVQVEGEVAYLVTESEKLITVDVEGDPVVLAELAIPATSLTSLTIVHGTHAYLLGIGGIFVVDVTDPANPVHVTTVSTINQPYWARVIGDAVVVNIVTYPSDVYDVSNPAQPAFLGHGPSLAEFVTVGSLAYGLSAQYLEVHDLTVPQNPVELGALSQVLGFGLSVDGCRVATFNPFLPQELRMFPTHCLAGTGVTSPASDELDVPVAVPNPFRSATSLRYVAPRAGSFVVAIYDVAGRPVRRLVDDAVAAGVRSVSWDARDDGGHRVASGTYYWRVALPSGPISGRLTLLD